LRGQETLTQRAERNKANPQFFESRQNFPLRFPPPKRIFALQRGHGLNGVSAANRSGRRFGQAEVFDLAFRHEILDGPGDIFDWHGGIDTVLIEQIDDVGIQPFERRVGHRPDSLRPAVQTLGRYSILEAEFGCDHGLLPKRRKRLTQEFFVGERTVGLGSIEKCHAEVESGSDQRNRLLFLGRRTVAET
jgi:hypothetical protein